MTERRDTLLAYPLLLLFLALLAWLSYRAGAPARPSMPGVIVPEARTVIAPAAETPAEQKVLEGKSTPEVKAELEAKATAEASEAVQAEAPPPAPVPAEAPPATEPQTWN